MFVLAEMTDTVRIKPHLFHMKLNDAIEFELNKKLANKVVPNVGLCIALHDITKLEDSHVIPGDGASHTKVHFRFVVFRPFIDEVLTGRIRSCSRDGVHVSLDFFDDILIPPTALQQASRFDENDQVWVWQYEADGETHDLFMDVNEEIRFKVVDEDFVDTTPVGPDDLAEPLTEGLSETQCKKAPYSLMGTISEPGLGLLSWWAS